MLSEIREGRVRLQSEVDSTLQLFTILSDFAGLSVYPKQSTHTFEHTSVSCCLPFVVVLCKVF